MLCISRRPAGIMRRQETFLAHVRMTKLTGLNDLSIVEEKAKTLVWNIRPCSGTASLRSVNLISSVPFELMDVVALPPAVLSKVTKLHVKTTPAPILNLRKLFLDAESFWVQLNYQLIHLMDFPSHSRLEPQAWWSRHCILCYCRCLPIRRSHALIRQCRSRQHAIKYNAAFLKHLI